MSCFSREDALINLYLEVPSASLNEMFCLVRGPPVVHWHL